MDALVFVSSGTVGLWDVYARDPKGLHLGVIRRGQDGRVGIEAEDHSPLHGVEAGPYRDLDAAMSAIARHLGGSCAHWVP